MMNSERFEQFKASVAEAKAIMRGEVKPSRVFEFEVVDRPATTEETWAICVDSDDHSLLIPRKLYLVRFVDDGVWVRDETGEMTSCDVEDFLPVAFGREVQERLARAA
jgi:hypothetical protein